MTRNPGYGPHAAILVCSTRAAEGVYPDRTGPLIERWLEERGWTYTLEVVPDGPRIGEEISRAITSENTVLVITSGGTGVSPTDVTPEQTAPLLGKELPGVAEEIRRRGTANTPTAILSRGLAGIAGGTVVVNLPGSPGGVQDGLSVLAEVVDHLLDQVSGADHCAWNRPSPRSCTPAWDPNRLTPRTSRHWSATPAAVPW